MSVPKPPSSKMSKLLQGLGEVMYTRSPMLGQALELTDMFKLSSEQKAHGQTRLGHALQTVKQMAVQNSPILRQAASVKDFFSSIFEKESPTETDSQQPPAPNEKQNFASKEMIEYLEKPDNPYMVILEESRNHLESIVGILSEQRQMLETMIRVGREASERSKTASDLGDVGRANISSTGALASMVSDDVGFVRPDMATMGQEGESDKESDDGFITKTMSWLKDNLAELIVGGGFIAKAYSATKGFMRKGISKVASWMPKGAMTKAFNVIKSTLTSFGSKVAPAATTVGTWAASKASTIANAGKSVVGKVLSGAGKVLPVVGRVLGPALIAKNIYDMEQRAKQISEESGISYTEALGMIQKENRDGLEQAFRNTPGLAQMMELYDKALEWRKDLFKQEESVNPMIPVERTILTPSIGTSSADEIEQYLRTITPDSSGSSESTIDGSRNTTVPSENLLEMTPQQLLPPAPIALMSPNIVGSTPLSKTENLLDWLIKDARKQNVTTEPSKSTGPIISNVQGGSTTVNSGGNVTNIIMGGSSLDLPQLAFNLPSSVS